MGGAEERLTDVGPEERRLLASADACFIGQNIYLFCASQGLATVFSRLRQSGQTGHRAEPAGRTIRDFRADGRLSARLSAQWLGAVMQANARGKSAVVGLEPIALLEPNGRA